MEKPRELKTRSMRKGTRLAGSLKQDLAALVEMPDAILQVIDQYFKTDAAYRRDPSEIINDIVDKFKIGAGGVTRVFSFVKTFGSYLDDEDVPADLLNDLLFEGIITEEEYAKAASKLPLISGFLESWRFLAKVMAAEGAGAPNLRGLSYSANLRLQKLRDGDDKPIEIKGLLPMGSIEICIDKLSGEESFSFQVDLNEVRDIIKNLNFLERELSFLDELAKGLKKDAE